MTSASNPVRPSSDAGTPVACTTAPCPLQPKSIHIDIGWTFSGGAPTGTYNLTLNGQNFTGLLNNGQIRIDRQLNSITGSGTLRIIITDGPTYRANVELGMSAIQSPAGLVQRLTNLGFYAGTDGIFDGRARWATVDTGGPNSGHEPAIEPRVAALDGPVAVVMVEQHPHSVPLLVADD